MCRDLELAVPGTYDPNQPIIRIQSIAPSLQVITSKQRPRKLTLMGERDNFHFAIPVFKQLLLLGQTIYLPLQPFLSDEVFLVGLTATFSRF